MIETIGGILATLLGGYIVDRFGYNRTIARAAQRLAPILPNKTARELAEAAVLAANQREIERHVEAQRKAAAKHEVRMAAIKAGGGDVNVGNLKE